MIRIGTLEEVYRVFQEIPELGQYLSFADMEHRLQGKHLLLVCEVKGQLAGFKIGYENSERMFYSWLGGVAPSYRSCGIAERLLLHQEEWAREEGYEFIEVKSMNQFPAMLRLLIKNKYQIRAVTDSGDVEREKIHFRKDIREHS